MRDFVIGFTAMVGPVIAWHMLVVSRRWDDDTPKPPSGSAAAAVVDAPAGAIPGPDGPDRCLRFVPVTTTTYGPPVRHNRNPYLCLKPLPCTAVHVEDLGEPTA